MSKSRLLKRRSSMQSHKLRLQRREPGRKRASPCTQIRGRIQQQKGPKSEFQRGRSVDSLSETGALQAELSPRKTTRTSPSIPQKLVSTSSPRKESLRSDLQNHRHKNKGDDCGCGGRHENTCDPNHFTYQNRSRQCAEKVSESPDNHCNEG